MGVYTSVNGKTFEFDSEHMQSLPEDKQEYMFDVYERRSLGQDTSIDVEAQRPSGEQLEKLVSTAMRDRAMRDKSFRFRLLRRWNFILVIAI